MNKLIATQLDAACNWSDDQRDGLLNAIHERFGDGVQAILIYGSYLRGKRDTLLDFYVLLEGYPAMKSRWHSMLAWMLSPNVYQVRYEGPAGQARAKYAVMTTARFEQAMQGDFHSYFWARFTQPSGLLYCRDDASREKVINAIASAARRFVQTVVPLLPDQFTASDLVSRGLSLTYQCELRSESKGHAATLFNHNSDYYRAVLELNAGHGLGYQKSHQAEIYENQSSARVRKKTSRAWSLRRMQGKLLSLLRLLKAALTFEDGFDYLIWKISRHSNIPIEPTKKQLKYPLIFAWPLLWRLYRQGAFR